jgi:hypothetical protein
MKSFLATFKEKLNPLLGSGVFSWILCGLASFPLVVLAYIGTFTRYMADDYNKVVTIENVGFWGAQVHWYLGWTGRFTSIFIASFLAIFDVLSGWISEKTTLVAMLVVVSLLAGYIGVSGQNFYSGKQTRALVYLFFVCFLALWMGFLPGWFIFAWIGNSLRQLSSPVFERMPKLALTFRAGLYILAITLTFLSPLRVGVSYVNLIPVFRHYAQLWDERDAYLRHAKIAGQTDVVVFSFKGHPDFRDIRKTIWVRGDMEDNPEYWINNEASAYYGLNPIIAVNETK